MNKTFWIEIQKCWRIKLSADDKQFLHNTAEAAATEWSKATITKPYSNNPLDDFEDDDEEDY